MTKTIYISWENHIIITDEEEKEQLFDEWIESNHYILDFAEWLEEFYEIITVYEMTAEEKAKLPIQYEKYVENEKESCRAQAEEAFKNEFEAIKIEVDKYDE